MERARRPVNRRAQSLERRQVVVVAVDVAESFDQLGEGRLIDSSVGFQAFAHAGPKLIEPPARLGHAHDRNVEMPVLDQRLKRGDDFLVSQVAGCPKEHQGVGRGLAHRVISLD